MIFSWVFDTTVLRNILCKLVSSSGNLCIFFSFLYIEFASIYLTIMKIFVLLCLVCYALAWDVFYDDTAPPVPPNITQQFVSNYTIGDPSWNSSFSGYEHLPFPSHSFPFFPFFPFFPSFPCMLSSSCASSLSLPRHISIIYNAITASSPWTMSMVVVSSTSEA